MMDLAQLLPHCKRDSKLDTKTDRGVINEVADMKVTDPKNQSVHLPDEPLRSRYVTCLLCCRVAAASCFLRHESARTYTSG